MKRSGVAAGEVGHLVMGNVIPTEPRDAYLGRVAAIDAGLPKEVVARLNSELGKIMHSADMKDRLNAMGVEPVTGTPEEFTRYIREQVAKWLAVVKASGAELE